MTEFNWTGSDEDGWECETEDGYWAYSQRNIYKGNTEHCVDVCTEDLMILEDVIIGDLDDSKTVAENAINAHRWTSKGKAAVEAVERVRAECKSQEYPEDFLLSECRGISRARRVIAALLPKENRPPKLSAEEFSKRLPIVPCIFPSEEQDQ
jgi:hypothetical protein